MGSASRPPAPPGPVLLQVQFYIRPQLYEYAYTLAGGEPLVLNNATKDATISALVRSCLVKHQPKPLSPGFTQERRPYTVLVSDRMARTHGAWVSEQRMRWLENMLNHHFFARLHAYAAGQIRHGHKMTASIMEFMDLHNISHEHCDYHVLHTLLNRGCYGHPPLRTPRRSAP